MTSEVTEYIHGQLRAHSALIAFALRHCANSESERANFIQAIQDLSPEDVRPGEPSKHFLVGFQQARQRVVNLLSQ